MIRSPDKPGRSLPVEESNPQPPDAPRNLEHLPPRRGSLAEVARVFLGLGLISFGGPAAHIALMEDTFVTRRRWLDRQTFLDLIAATNLIPGPNSTEMAIHLGYLRAGWPGLLVAGVCFILPASLLVGGLAALYVVTQQLPAVEHLFYALKPLILAIIVHALVKLSGVALKTRGLVCLALGCGVAVGFGLNELLVLFAAGLLALVGRGNTPSPGTASPPSPLPMMPLLLATTPAPVLGFSQGGLFLIFLKIGAVLFGSGYVLLAFLRADLVERTGWLEERQLLDAVAIGQVTPGPLFTTATFIGYLLGGPVGATLATIGIFLPAFVFVAVTAPFLERLRQSRPLAAFLDGLNAASLALMVVTTIYLARVAVIDVLTGLLALAGLVALLVFRLSTMWLIGLGLLVAVLRW